MKNGRKLSLTVPRPAKTLIVLAYWSALCSFDAEAAPLVPKTRTMQYSWQIEYEQQDFPDSGGIEFEKTASTGIYKFRNFVGIDATGNMDVGTELFVNSPGYDAVDTIEPRSGEGSNRHIDHVFKWEKKNLSYKISKYPSSFDSTDVDKEIARAFAVWSNYTNLSFSPENGKVDIEIRFDSTEHSVNPSAIAYNFFPTLEFASVVHFDENQNWTIGSNRGINLLQVAVHQFGQSLGLTNSNISSAVMFPFTRKYNPNFTLDSNDIARIQVSCSSYLRGGYTFMFSYEKQE